MVWCVLNVTALFVSNVLGMEQGKVKDLNSNVTLKIDSQNYHISRHAANHSTVLKNFLEFQSDEQPSIELGSNNVSKKMWEEVIQKALTEGPAYHLSINKYQPFLSSEIGENIAPKAYENGPVRWGHHIEPFTEIIKTADFLDISHLYDKSLNKSVDYIKENIDLLDLNDEAFKQFKNIGEENLDALASKITKLFTKPNKYQFFTHKEMIKTNSRLRVFGRRALKMPIIDLAYSSDGTMLALALYEHVELWNISNGMQQASLITILNDHGTFAWKKVALSHNGNILAVASNKGTVFLYDLSSGPKNAKLITNITGQTFSVTSLVFNYNDTLLALSSYDFAIKILDVSLGLEQIKQVGMLTDPRGVIRNLSFNPVCNKLISSGTDSIIQIWDLSAPSPRLERIKLSKNVSHVTCNPDGTLYASIGDDKTVSLWNTQTNALLYTLIGHTCKVVSISFSSNGKKLISCDSNGVIKVWDISPTGTLLATLQESFWSHAIAFSIDGKSILSSPGAILKIWSVPHFTFDQAVVMYYLFKNKKFPSNSTVLDDIQRKIAQKIIAQERIG
jgi:WD40 repeat protein